MLSNRRLPMYLTVGMFAALLGGCGSSGSGDVPTQAMIDAVKLNVRLAPQGTLVECDGPTSVVLTLTRQADVAGAPTASCPGTTLLQGDSSLSSWTLTASMAPGAAPFVTRTATTALPDPVAVPNGDAVVILRSAPLSPASIAGLALVASRNGTAVGVFDDPTTVPVASLGGDASTVNWQWQVIQGGITYTSSSVPGVVPTTDDLGYWGAMSVGDINGDGVPEFLGTVTTGGVATPTSWTQLGLQDLFTDRAFRDIRQVDLNGDARADIISNVYGTGCTLIGLSRADGGYDWQTPTRSDGSCIAGDGETILVADFDGDGAVDIVLPSYELVDYLHNDGTGHFSSVDPASSGLDYPLYRPTFEGATAVDLDLNGTVDIVMGSEVLLNDGQGHFTAQDPLPLGRIQDEGLSVADLDGDGIYDVVRLHPVYGLLPYWGQPDRVHFTSDGYLGGGAAVFDQAFGMTVGNMTGHSLADIVVAGGNPAGTPSHVCVQPLPRQFECLDQVLPSTGSSTSQGVPLLADVDGDGQNELYARDSSIRRYTFPARAADVFRIDLRDAAGSRTLYGHSMRATCALDGSLVGLRFVDGGNGYLGQGDYVVDFTSSWCPAVNIEVATRTGMLSYGPYAPGTRIIQLPAGSV